MVMESDTCDTASSGTITSNTMMSNNTFSVSTREQGEISEEEPNPFVYRLHPTRFDRLVVSILKCCTVQY